MKKLEEYKNKILESYDTEVHFKIGDKFYTVEELGITCFQDFSDTITNTNPPEFNRSIYPEYTISAFNTCFLMNFDNIRNIVYHHPPFRVIGSGIIIKSDKFLRLIKDHTSQLDYIKIFSVQKPACYIKSYHVDKIEDNTVYLSHGSSESGPFKDITKDWRIKMDKNKKED